MCVFVASACQVSSALSCGVRCQCAETQRTTMEHQCESHACVASVSASACFACLGVGRLFASRVYPAFGVSSLSCLLWVPVGLLWNHSSAQHAVIPVIARARRVCGRGRVCVRVDVWVSRNWVTGLDLKKKFCLWFFFLSVLLAFLVFEFVVFFLFEKKKI